MIWQFWTTFLAYYDMPFVLLPLLDSYIFEGPDTCLCVCSSYLQISLIFTTSFIGNFVRLYLEQDVKSVKTMGFGQIAEELRYETVFFCSGRLFEK